jgi:hypothetical protein
MFLVLLLLISPFAAAQKIVSARAGMVYFAEGALTIDGNPVRAGSRDRRPQLEDGQTISSTRGHAEVLIGPNAVLWTGTLAQVRFDDTRIEETNVSIISGAAIIEVKRVLAGSRLQVSMGALTVELAREGLYRFEATPQNVRVYAGEALLSGGTRLGRGQEMGDRNVRSFERDVMDEFHYWSAYRSFWLEGEAGSYRMWSGGKFFEREHAGFGVAFPETPGAARAKYQAASEAGLVYFLQGSALIGGQTRATSARLPLLLGRENFVQTDAGKAELFLGVGVIARLGENSQLRMLETLSTSSLVALEEGAALIEVAESAGDSPPRVKIGASVTELLKPGLYFFDANAGQLRVYGGEASTALASTIVRVKESQTADLREPGPATKFDAKIQDALYRWSADRSFALFLSPAGFMTSWDQAPRSNRYKHKQFGERQASRSRARTRF